MLSVMKFQIILWGMAQLLRYAAWRHQSRIRLGCTVMPGLVPGIHMWTAPDLQEMRSAGRAVHCAHMSGVRSGATASLDGVRGSGPNTSAAM